MPTIDQLIKQAKFGIKNTSSAPADNTRYGEFPGVKTKSIPKIASDIIVNTTKKRYSQLTTDGPDSVLPDPKKYPQEALDRALNWAYGMTGDLSRVGVRVLQKEVASNLSPKVSGHPIMATKTQKAVQKKMISSRGSRAIEHFPEKTLVDKLVNNYSIENVSRALRSVKDPNIKKAMSREIAMRIRDAAKQRGDYYAMTGNVSSDIPRTSGFKQNLGIGEGSPDYVVKNGSWTEGRGYYSTVLDNFKKTGSFYSAPNLVGRDISKLHINLVKGNKGMAPLGWDLNEHVYSTNVKRAKHYDNYAYTPVGHPIDGNNELRILANKVAFNDWLTYSGQTVKNQLPYDKPAAKFSIVDGVPTLEYSADSWGAGSSTRRIKAAGKRFKLAKELSPIDVPVDMNNRFYNRTDYEDALNFLSSPDSVIKIASKRIQPPKDNAYSGWGHHGGETQYTSNEIDKLVMGSGWEKNAYYVTHPKEAATLYGYPLSNSVLKELIDTDVVHKGATKALIDLLVGIKH